MDVNSSSHPHPHQTYTANALDPAIDALPPSQTPTLNDQHVSPATQTEKAAPAEMTPAPTPLSKDETGLAPAEAEKDAIERKADLDEDEIVYPTKLKLFLISLALCLAVFLVALDQTIIATAIPKITDHFSALEDVGWYGSSYLLTTCAFQLIFGKFYTFFSIKWVFLSAIGVFELGSLICGAAPTSVALIIGRAIAGLGVAGIFSGALIIVANAVPLHQRPIYTGLIGAMYGVASVAGPLLGGVFTDKATWRWCFYINLPIGAVTVVVIGFFFTSPRKKAVSTLTLKQKVAQMDLLGTAIFVPTIVCLLLALQWGGSKYPWNSGRIIALLVLAGVFIIVFIAIQFWKGDAATLPPRIISQRTVAFSAWYSFTIGAAFFVFIFYIPIWFQAIKGTTAVQSGINNLPMILGVVIFSIVSGGLVTVLGYYTPFMIASSVIMSIGAGLLTTLEVDTGSPKWIGYQALFGIGIGLGLQQSLMAVQTVLSLNDVPTGTAVIIFVQTLGGALFISIAQNIFTNKLVDGLAAAAPSLDPGFVLRVGATSIKKAIEDINPSYWNGVQFAYNDAIIQTFYVGLAMSCFTILGAVGVEWRSVKGKQIVAAAA